MPSARGLAAALPATVLAGFVAVIAAADLRPAPAIGEMAVVYAPWTGEVDAMRAVIAAGGSIAGNSRLGNIVIAYASDPGFAERARAAGAWVTFAASGLCGPIQS